MAIKSVDMPATPLMRVINENPRVFNESDTATIVMGDGMTIVSDVTFSDDGLCGVCFSENGVNIGVGTDHEYLNGLSTDEIMPYFQILSANKSSLQVIVDRLNCAIKALELQQEDK